MSGRPTPTGRERRLGREEVIVSKTDLQGKITYANHHFMHISGFTQRELLGMPHSLIRHPDMPRCVFKLLWETLQAGQEVFAYVVNLCKDGDHYWVLAHVTPSFDATGRVVGYHSNRRAPDPGPLARARELYATLLAEERRHADRRQGLAASWALLQEHLGARGLSYDELLFTVIGACEDAA